MAVPTGYQYSSYWSSNYFTPKSRWNTHRIRSLRAADIHVYRDEFDGLLDTQVIWDPYPVQTLAMLSHICLEGSEIWLSRVPLISWQRVEWHLPDRVLRQFGLFPQTDILCMEEGYVRVDGRGKSGTDWFAFHCCYIELWELRHEAVFQPDLENNNRARAVRRYMKWYRAWASLYLLRAPHQAPAHFGARSVSDKVFRDFFGKVETCLQPAFGTTVPYIMPPEDVSELEGLCSDVRRNIHISDSDVYEDDTQQHEEIHQEEFIHSSYGYGGPSTLQSAHDMMGSGSTSHPPETTDDHELHALRGRHRRAPQHYTPRTDALPPMRRRTRK